MSYSSFHPIISFSICRFEKRLEKSLFGPSLSSDSRISQDGFLGILEPISSFGKQTADMAIFRNIKRLEGFALEKYDDVICRLRSVFPNLGSHPHENSQIHADPRQ